MSCLVTGATGNIGSLVVDALLARGLRPRLFVRNAERARARFGDRVDLTVGDLDEGHSLATALTGMDAVFLVSSGSALDRQDAAAAAAARAAGVTNLVKLSSLDVEHGVGTGVWHARGEEAIRASGVGFTFVRPTGFMSNALYWAKGIAHGGVVRSSTGAGRIPFVHPLDIAEVSVHALLGSPLGRALPLTGPKASSYAEMTEIIGAALGRTLRYEEITDDEARAMQQAWGADPALLEARLAIFQAIRAGRLAKCTSTVEGVTGRPPRSFASWVAENVAAFR